MSAGGWLFLVLSWSFILGLVAFCFWRTFTRSASGNDAAGSEPAHEG